MDKEQIPILEHADTDQLPLHGHTAESEHDLKQLKSLKSLDDDGHEKASERDEEDKKPDPEYVASNNGKRKKQHSLVVKVFCNSI